MVLTMIVTVLLTTVVLSKTFLSVSVILRLVLFGRRVLLIFVKNGVFKKR